STTNPDSIINAIASNNVAYLKKLPGIGSKAAAQIILDLKGELTPGEKGNPKQYDEVYEALKELGFKGAAIDRVLSTINEPGATTEDIMRIALQKLRK
ncbi:MAG: Holliday junction branch migration protein RuvA, partial [Bacilli bacterium]|nr:Holliday junction branch migration protein RuvA [Bacilli bacterium]